MKRRRSMVNTGDISPEPIGEYRLRRKGRVKEMGFIWSSHHDTLKKAARLAKWDQII